MTTRELKSTIRKMKRRAGKVMTKLSGNNPDIEAAREVLYEIHYLAHQAINKPKGRRVKG